MIKNIFGFSLIALIAIQPAFGQTSREAAQSQGFAADNGISSGVAGNLTSDKVTNVVPGYTSQTPSSLTSSFGGTSLMPQGLARNAECDQQGIVDKGDSQKQECNVSIIVRQNSNQQQFAANDPILGIKPNQANLALGGETKTQTCAPVTTTTPAVTEQQTCNEFLKDSPQKCDKNLVITMSSAPGCSVNGQYIGSTRSNVCSYCIDPYVVTDYYCSGGGYVANSYTSPSGATGHVFSYLFTNVYVSASVGQNVSNQYLGNFGGGCNFPMYFSQSCGSTHCQLYTSLIGSTCNGKDFTASGSFQMPIKVTMSETWQDTCTYLNGLIR